MNLRKISMIIAFVFITLGVILFVTSWHFSNQLITPKPYTCQKDHFVYCNGIEE